MKKVNIENSNENVFAVLQRITSEGASKENLTYEDISKALDTIAIENLFEGFLDVPIKKSFFDKNGDLIIERIKVNKNLSTAIRELSFIYTYQDEDTSDIVKPEFKNTVKITMHFIENLVWTILSLEIDYLIKLKEMYKGLHKNNVKGKFINCELTKETITLNENSFDILLNNIGMIVKHYSLLLKMKNSEWLEQFFKERYNKSDKKRQGKQGEEIPSEKELFINKIKQAKNRIAEKSPGKRISVSAVAREFGKADSTFREWLKNNKINKNDFNEL